MGILQARIVEWVAMPYSRGSSQPRDQTQVFCTAGRLFTVWATREAQILLILDLKSSQQLSFRVTVSGMKRTRLGLPANPYTGVCAKSLQSCPTLCTPMDCSLPGSSVCGILQARILEWVAMPSSRESSQPRDQTQVFCTASRFFTSWGAREAPYLLFI